MWRITMKWKRNDRMDGIRCSGLPPGLTCHESVAMQLDQSMSYWACHIQE